MQEWRNPAKKWKTAQIQHEPIHPYLQAERKHFMELLNIGTTFEEANKLRLQRLFEYIDAYCDRITTDAEGRQRALGKRIYLCGQEYVAPDFAVGNSGHLEYLVDLKSKQYHSFYHKTRQIQQAVNVSHLHDYLTLSDYFRRPVLILFHLWPAEFMGNYGLADVARIHTGVNMPLLDDSVKASILLKYPVNDHYYLISARKLKRIGRLGTMAHDDGDLQKGQQVYFFNLAAAYQGRTEGMIPPLQAWELAAKET